MDHWRDAGRLRRTRRAQLSSEVEDSSALSGRSAQQAVQPDCLFKSIMRLSAKIMFAQHDK